MPYDPLALSRDVYWDLVMCPPEQFAERLKLAYQKFSDAYRARRAELLSAKTTIFSRASSSIQGGLAMYLKQKHQVVFDYFYGDDASSQEEQRFQALLQRIDQWVRSRYKYASPSTAQRIPLPANIEQVL